MSDLVAKCGIDCGACPWGPFPRQGMTSEDFERNRCDAKRILGYMPIKTPCLTCQTPDKEIPKGSKLPNRKCLIRQCVDMSRIENCAFCSRFPCDTVKETAGAWNRKSIEGKLGAPLSEEEYHAFVEPFEGIDRLKAIRASLKSERVVEPAKAPKSGRMIADFPENLPFSNGEIASLGAVHKLLTTLACSSLGLEDTDTFAQQHKLETRRAHVLRFLWIFGNYGRFEKEKGARLTVDAKTYEDNRGTEKTLAIWSFVKDTVFKVLSDLGVRCERVALNGTKEEGLVTGTGYLRSRGWVMKMSFDEKIGGAAALKALLTYARRAEKEYGVRAFQHFRDADMRVFFET